MDTDVMDCQQVIGDGTPQERFWSYAKFMATALEIKKEYFNAAWLEESRKTGGATDVYIY